MDGIDFYLYPQKQFDLTLLQKWSTLDESQAKAVIKALTTKFALIQGPPGTGKSYCGVEVIRVLLDNKELRPELRGAQGLGPILVVCYTNHALDQLLEHLLRAKVNQIIRIGSRSNSELIKPLNLRQVLRDNGMRTKREKALFWELRHLLEDRERQLTRICNDLANAGH
jgi:Rad3-related DNA helicase